MAEDAGLEPTERRNALDILAGCSYTNSGNLPQGMLRIVGFEPTRYG